MTEAFRIELHRMMYILFSDVLIFVITLFAESKKEEKKAESESEDDDMGFGLFD